MLRLNRFLRQRITMLSNNNNNNNVSYSRHCVIRHYRPRHA